MIVHPHHSMDSSITHEPSSGRRQVNDALAASSSISRSFTGRRGPHVLHAHDRRDRLSFGDLVCSGVGNAGRRIKPCYPNSTRVPSLHDRQQSERRVTELLDQRGHLTSPIVTCPHSGADLLALATTPSIASTLKGRISKLMPCKPLFISMNQPGDHREVTSRSLNQGARCS